MGRTTHRALDSLIGLARIGGRLVEGPLASLISTLGKTIGRDTPGSSKGSGDHAYTPVPESNSVLTSHPLIPTFIVVVLLLLVAFSTPVQTWITTAKNLPSLTQIFALAKGDRSNTLTQAREDVAVWTKRQFGFYYCRGGVLFGNKPGEMMTQAEALTVGYRPASGQYCSNRPGGQAYDNSLPVRLERRVYAAENKLSNLTLSAKLAWEKRTGMPKADEKVSVWTKNQSGFYYCQGSVLFGIKPGETMTQGKALLAGYRPAGAGYCPNGTANEASVGSLSLRNMNPIK